MRVINKCATEPRHRDILTDCCLHFQEHLQNPAIMQKIMKLKDAGLISMSYK